MALSGIREMSIIATPPVDRLGGAHLRHARRSHRGARGAYCREKYRGGQAYYVAPRVSDLPALEKFLRDQACRR